MFTDFNRTSRCFLSVETDDDSFSTQRMKLLGRAVSSFSLGDGIDTKIPQKIPTERERQRINVSNRKNLMLGLRVRSYGNNVRYPEEKILYKHRGRFNTE